MPVTFPASADLPTLKGTRLRSSPTVSLAKVKQANAFLFRQAIVCIAFREISLSEASNRVPPPSRLYLRRRDAVTIEVNGVRQRPAFAPAEAFQIRHLLQAGHRTNAEPGDRTYSIRNPQQFLE